MGRPRKENITADAESIEYINRVISKYPVLKECCQNTEEKRPSLIRRSGIKSAAFLPGKSESTEMLILPSAKGNDLNVLERYLDAKEQTYLLERGVYMLAGAEQAVARMMFLERNHWRQVAEYLHISKATVFRIRSQALIKIAIWVDSFMRWKVNMLYV